MIFPQSKASIDAKILQLHRETKAPWELYEWEGNEVFAVWLLEAVRDR